MRGMKQPLLVNMFFSHGNVFGNAVRKDKAVLHHRATTGTPCFGIHIFQVDTTHTDAALVRRVKPQQKFDQSSLAAATHPDHCRHLSFWDGKVHVFEYSILQRVIMESEILHFQALILGENTHFVVTVLGFVFLVMDFPQTFKADFGILSTLYEANHLPNGRVQLSHNGLHRHHHTKCHVSLNDRSCRKE